MQSEEITMIEFVLKRDGNNEKFASYKIEDAIKKAFKSEHVTYDSSVFFNVLAVIQSKRQAAVEDIQDLIEKELYKPFYMHRTGHWLGLDVHDVGTYKHNKETWQNFQPGHIVTVEPGIYISPFIKPVEGQPEVPDNWKGIGIRIEDDLLVTENGHDILTADVPKSVAEMER